jgi:hypothetical protein
MGFDLSYNLVGTGWAKCAVHVDGSPVTVTASYLSHALDDLASAVAAALRGHGRRAASSSNWIG